MPNICTKEENSPCVGSKSTKKCRSVCNERHSWTFDCHKLRTKNEYCDCHKLKTMNDYSCTSSRIFYCCERLKKPPTCAPCLTEFKCQVAATDITRDICTQTCPDLALRSAELPRKRFVCNQTLKANKCPEMACEHKRLSERGCLKDSSVQVDPRCIGSDHEAQTGPSLTSVGPFCRFDYKLKKTGIKNDLYVDCCEPKTSVVIIICSKDRDNCSHVNQQVSSTDICTSESMQTGDKDGPCDKVIYGRCSPEIPGKTIKASFLLDCDRPAPRDKQQKSCKCSVELQVCPDDICCHKISQTDQCLTPGRCRRPRIFRDSSWVCERDARCLPCSQKYSSTACNNFTQQVLATFIGDTQETQTCCSLVKQRPFVRGCSDLCWSRRRGCGDRSIVGRPRCEDWCDFNCDLRCPESKGEVVNACTQYCQGEVFDNKDIQTCGPGREIVKCFVRGQHWACQTFC